MLCDWGGCLVEKSLIILNCIACPLPQCVEQMTRRQKLMVRDYQVSRGLVRACRSAISENQCRRGLGDQNHDVKLSHILLCLEDAEKKGTLKMGFMELVILNVYEVRMTVFCHE